MLIACGAWAAFGVSITGPNAIAQDFPSPKQRESALEQRLDELEDEVKDLKKDLKDVKKDAGEKFADGILTLGGGAELRFGGKIELLFLDSEDDVLTGLGAGFVTDEPEAHLELQRLRLEPVIDFNRWISARGQLDFRPTDGDTVLKELVVRHDSNPWWWLESRVQVGLDDRFIRPGRRTKTYPLIGNAFWRDESLAFTWALSFGHRRGLEAARARALAAEAGDAKSSGKKARGGAGTEGFADVSEPEDVSTMVGDAAPAPFDFATNWGELQVIFSLGQGYELGANEVGFDRARFNDLVQDDRELEDDLALREYGLGLAWRREFGALGDLDVLGFYFVVELRSGSVAFLQGPEMTSRLPDNTVTGGYGDSNHTGSSRHGIAVEYFVPASTLLETLEVDTRKSDGLRVVFQWIHGDDGDFEREGWYVQGSYRVSFGKLVADRYFRSLEPIVRYGRLDVDVPNGKALALAGTWDRDALMVGGFLEITGEIFLKLEYVFHGEDTGSRREVDNDELLVELLITFD